MARASGPLRSNSPDRPALPPCGRPSDARRTLIRDPAVTSAPPSRSGVLHTASPPAASVFTSAGGAPVSTEPFRPRRTDAQRNRATPPSGRDGPDRPKARPDPQARSGVRRAGCGSGWRGPCRFTPGWRLGVALRAHLARATALERTAVGWRRQRHDIRGAKRGRGIRIGRRNRSKQNLRSGLRRCRIDGSGRSDLAQASVAKDANPIRQCTQHGKVVTDEDIGRVPAASQPIEKIRHRRGMPAGFTADDAHDWIAGGIAERPQIFEHHTPVSEELRAESLARLRKRRAGCYSPP